MSSTRMVWVYVSILLLALETLLAAPVLEDNEGLAKGAAFTLRSRRDVDIKIPEKFNLKLSRGIGGTDLNIDIPAILNLQVDRTLGRRGGMLLDIFGASRTPSSR
ncbi:hypothetical protein V5799_019239 [Amblyomma americanum]|uniref:Secreted protein n=1 Tax=Amblyomma americanum TaxID=6943 RepID=A0AAQ4EXC8_AMBAM